ncbi:hypothetical protein A1507_19850 [Methylomonas koyamae]|uniref:Uncharacterized protein n=1 Tax=Methylomonas koyamae TaxID=702114 RepID=A0A177N2A8_9GAMM|nr:SGNH/GDSL hydrolase family protein [Methylomonas koyamae]OAI11784.1 hypothetical protein A1507_19850 [Methylomonas koyamae]
MSGSRFVNRRLAKVPPAVTNPKSGDVTAPTAPGTPVVSNVTAGGSATVTVSAASDGVGVVGYVVFLDDNVTESARSSTTAINLTGISVGVHTVAVRAVDSANNYSDASASTTFEIPASAISDLRVVKNLYPISSETFTGSVNNTGVPVNGVALTNAPFGVKTGVQLSSGATAGFCQRNQTVVADDGFWVFSFVGFVPAGVTGAQAKITNTGFNGGDIASLTYDWDAPLTASVGLPGQSVSATVASKWVVQDLGNGYKRFSYAFKNDGTKTVFAYRIDSSVAYDKTVYTAFMLERKPVGASLLPSDYVPTNDLAPYPNGGTAFGGYTSKIELPFSHVRSYSDSILGAGTYSKIGGRLTGIFGRGSANVLGETWLYEDGHGQGSGKAVLTRFYEDKAAAAGGIDDFSRALIVFNGGYNDGAPDAAKRQRMTDEIQRAIDALGTPYYIVIGVLMRFALTSNSGASAENKTTNVAAYKAKKALNQLWREKFGAHFFDAHSASVNAYDPRLSTDVAAFSLDMRPPSLTNTGGTDDTHPNDAEAQVITAGLKALAFDLFGSIK